MVKVFPLHPANPQRICWGCDKYCAADALACSAERTPHLAELFGDDWADWAPGNPAGHPASDDPATAAPPPGPGPAIEPVP